MRARRRGSRGRAWRRDRGAGRGRVGPAFCDARAACAQGGLGQDPGHAAPAGARLMCCSRRYRFSASERLRRPRRGRSRPLARFNSSEIPRGDSRRSPRGEGVALRFEEPRKSRPGPALCAGDARPRRAALARPSRPLAQFEPLVALALGRPWRRDRGAARGRVPDPPLCAPVVVGLGPEHYAPSLAETWFNLVDGMRVPCGWRA